MERPICVNHFDKFSIVFLPCYISNPLQELKINFSDINDSIKEDQFKRSLSGNGIVDNSGLNETIKTLIDNLGKSDMKDFAGLNYLIHNFLKLNIYENSFIRLFEETLQGDHYHEENSFRLIETFRAANLSSSNIKDTYSITKYNDVIVIEVKEGFGNFISGLNKVKVMYDILKDIIDIINKESIINSSIGRSFIKLTNLL